MPTPVGMRQHFFWRHPRDTICIEEEGSVPLPKCELCGFQTTYRSLNGSRYNPRSCVEGRRRREKAAALERARATQEHVFSVYGTALESVRTFKYLGRILSYDNND